MKSLCKLVPREGSALALVIQSADAGSESEIPLTSPHASFDSLAEELGQIKKELDRLLSEAEQWFSSRDAAENASPEEMWASLSSCTGEEELIKSFNALSETQRAAVADYVLATQNVFKGFAALFTMRYDDSNQLLV